MILKVNNLVRFNLFKNKFTNKLSSSLTNCTSLVRVRIQNNEFNALPVTKFEHVFYILKK
ncbi:hypothetical protein MTR_4g115570 [Medicago truncatula]|uniref:Uncharacterized protein n=1 Tax=Medicago truncatula TaxID=3880 RepID=G7JFE8_MEDTR|nr:hypothetical protein MTR_4g115570 [Medicago truncatula]